MVVNLLCVVLDMALVVSYLIEVRCIRLGMKTGTRAWMMILLAALWALCTILAVKRVISGDMIWMDVILLILAVILVVLRMPFTVEHWKFLKMHKK